MMVFSAWELKGPDARDFLQRLSTVNTSKLALGQGTRGLFLSDTSKVKASFHLLAVEAERYLFFSSDGEITTIAEYLEQMHFGERLEAKSFPGYGYFLPSEQASEGEFFSFTQEPGKFIVPLPGKQSLLWSAEPLDIHSQFSETDRILAKWPLIGAEWRPGESNALDIGFLSWIHEEKGCYPGQEVVEKSLRIGHPAKALILFDCPALVKPGDALLRDGARVGSVTSFHSQKGLSLVQWKHREIGQVFVVQSDGQPIGEARCLK